MTTLYGYLENITYYNDRNHYTIAKLRPHDAENVVTVIGYMPGTGSGENLKIKGSWENHQRYGRQFRVDSFEVVLPSTVNEIKKYLRSGFIHGIGNKMSDRIVRHFQEKTFDIIENNPERLVEVDGIGKNKAARIIDDWKSHHALRNLMRFLVEHGIKPSYCTKLFKLYGEDAVQILCNDPFRLVDDIPGIGFSIADAMSISLGMPENDPKRIKACIMNRMELASAQGHTFMFENELERQCESIFKIELHDIENAIENLADSGKLVFKNVETSSDTRAVYNSELYKAESGIASRMMALLSIPVRPSDIDSEQITQAVLKKLAIKLSPEQLHVLEEILAHKASVITGGPGTGKTTLIRSITSIFELLGKKILLAAPTGRAARRLSEASHRKAVTIHKLLEYNLADGRFDKNQDNPLDADTIIIDEASMIDTKLMFHLIHAIPMTSSLILVGDIFQLPSVGPGNILSDMIKSDIVPTYYLKKIFRQAQESPIIINAHKVRNGEAPDFLTRDEATGLSEFYFIEQNSPDGVVKKIIELCKHRIPDRFHLDCMKEIQVLTPMHRGEAGTLNLNRVLQKALNHNQVEIRTDFHAFKPDDKVMHLKNNYQKEVFNGDIGTIHSIDKEKRVLGVNYYDREVNYDFEELEELSLAYAISVHKSQGSEYPAVVVPLLTQHFALLQRNLLYTAISRGIKLVVLIGSRKALSIALNNDKPRKRLSGLAAMLREY